MRKLLKIVLRTGIILVVLLVLAALAVRFLVPADRLAARAAELAAERTGAEVSLGAAHLTLWPRIRLVLEDVSITGRGDELARRTGGGSAALVSYELTAARAAADLGWGPLLHRRLEVGEVGFDSPRIVLVTDSARAGTGTGDAGGAAAFAVAALQVRDGALQWRDVATGRTLCLTGWSQSVDLGDVSRLLARLHAAVDGAAAAADPGGAAVVSLRVGLGELALEGFSPDGAQSFRDLEIEAALRVPAGAAAWPLEIAAVRWGGLDLAADGTVTPRADGAALALDWRLVALDPAALRSALPGAAPSLPPAFKAWLNEAEPTLQAVEAAGRCVLSLPLPDGDPVAAFLAGFTLEGAVEGLALRPPRLPRAWVVDSRLSLHDAVLECGDVEVAIDGGRIRGGLVVSQLGTDAQQCRYDLRCEGVEIRTLLEAVLPSAAPFVEGATDAVLAGGLELGDPAVVRRSLTLEGDVLLREGIVHAGDWLDGVSQYLGKRQDLKEIRYASLGDHLKIANGRAYLPGLVIDGHDTDWTGRGWIDLDGDIDLALNVKFPPGFKPDLGSMTPLAEALRGPDGRIALDLKLTGRAASPQVGLELKPAGDQLGGQLQQGVKGLLDRLRTRK